MSLQHDLFESWWNKYIGPLTKQEAQYIFMAGYENGYRSASEFSNRDCYRLVGQLRDNVSFLVGCIDKVHHQVCRDHIGTYLERANAIVETICKP